MQPTMCWANAGTVLLAQDTRSGPTNSPLGMRRRGQVAREGAHAMPEFRRTTLRATSARTGTVRTKGDTRPPLWTAAGETVHTTCTRPSERSVGPPECTGREHLALGIPRYDTPGSRSSRTIQWCERVRILRMRASKFDICKKLVFKLATLDIIDC